MGSLRGLTAISAALLAVLAVALRPAAGADSPLPTSSPPEAIEEVEVIAESPGPQLWRVSRNGHDLWILGTLRPLPQNLKWRSSQVERILSNSQALILGGVDVDADIGPITALKLYLQWRRIRHNPDNQTLDLLLPPALYARLEVVRDRYDRNDRELDRYQPMFAAARLFRRALRSARLSNEISVQRTILKLARQHHVRTEQIKLEIEDPRGLLSLIGATPQAAQITCLQTTLTHLETDVSVVRQRAQAWATGDVPQFSADAACWTAIANSPRIRALAERARSSWVEAVDAALERNTSTLALQSIDRLLGADGLLETLRAKGYSIEGP
jgi:uncharacterized protein YbaP (TraB family)